MRSRLGCWIADRRLPAPERHAARAERAVEARIYQERYPAVCFDERRRAALEAERRKWAWLGEWPD
jgi:hypothetical protein